MPSRTDGSEVVAAAAVTARGFVATAPAINIAAVVDAVAVLARKERRLGRSLLLDHDVCCRAEAGKAAKRSRVTNAANPNDTTTENDNMVVVRGTGTKWGSKGRLC